MKAPTKPGSLVMRPGVRVILGVSKERVRQLEDHPSFPAPVDVIDEKHPVWDKAEMEAYGQERNTAHGRPATAEPAAA